VSTKSGAARLWLAGIFAVGTIFSAPIAAPAAAQEMKFFRIGTGGTAGTYFPIGGLIANAVSAPPGSRACNAGGACGVPGLVAIAIAANGAIANVNDIQDGRLEAGFTQSDVAYWAFTGTGVFEGREKTPDLRGIANLYPETVHIVVRRDSGIATVSDLKGKRVSLEEPGSGTLADARILLNAYGMSERDLKPEYLKPDAAGKKLAAGELDAFFFVGGAPVAAITELAAQTPIGLVPIGGAQAEKALTRYSFFAWDRIPAGTYPGIADVPTISVSAILVTSAKQDEELIHGVTEALWNSNSRKLLDGGHSKGKLIVKSNATKGLGIPLHPGAERYYREAGMLPKTP
jgi:TRAP transporter TAXI family solute receptor